MTPSGQAATGRAPKAPKVEPYKHIEFSNKQSAYEHVPKLPMRAMIVGPSGSGKTIFFTKYDFEYL